MMLEARLKTVALALVTAATTACPPSTITAPATDARVDAAPTELSAPPDAPSPDQGSAVDAQPTPDLSETTDGLSDDLGDDSGTEDRPTLPDGTGDEWPAVPDTLPADDLPDATNAPDAPDAPPVSDLPVPTDAPTPGDVPAPPADVSVACGFVVQRALALPTDREMASLSGPSRLTAMCAASAGPDHVYTLHVDARTWVMLTTSDASFDTVLSVRRTCTDPRSEIACNDDVSGSNNSRVRVVLDPGDYFVVVDQFGAMLGMGGSYALNLRAFTPAPNAECAGAIALSASAPTVGDTLNGGAPSGACQNSADGPQSFYTLSVPPGRRATLRAAATAATPPWRPVVRVLNACGATSCRTSATAPTAPTAPTAATATVDNRGSTALSLVVTVASTTGSVGGAFSLGVAFSDVPPPPTNTTCMAATTLTPPATLSDQNSSLGTENATGACLMAATGTVLYYHVRVPSRHTMRAQVTPSSSMDPVVRVLATCPSTSCLVSENRAALGATETAAYTNTSSADQTVTLAVGGASNATNGSFDIDVSTERAYTESSIPTNCDAMTGATALMGLGGDDTHTPLLDLPFPFTFFGEHELEHSVTSNGLIQLFPTLVGAGSNVFENVAIANTSEPNGLIAALWDDLMPVMGSSVLARVLGTAPNRHYTIQWTAFGFYTDNSARLTFQAKLFESTGVIELHYCTLTPGMMAPLATGSSATVGIESPSGRSGQQHSFNTPMSVNTTAAIRFSP